MTIAKILTVQLSDLLSNAGVKNGLKPLLVPSSLSKLNVKMKPI
jgi:hypothetical protein